MRTGPTSLGEGRPGPPCLPRRSQGLELSWARVGPGLSIPKSPQGPPMCRDWRTAGAACFPAPGPSPAPQQNPRVPWGFTWSQVTGEPGWGQAEHASGRLPPIGHLAVPASLPASEDTRSLPSMLPSRLLWNLAAVRTPFHLLPLPIFDFNAVMRLGASSNAYTLAPQSGVTGPGGCLGPHTVTSSRAGETATCQSRISSFSLRLLTLFAWSCYFPPRVPFISKVTKTQDTLATPFLLCPSRPASTPAILL